MLIHLTLVWNEYPVVPKYSHIFVYLCKHKWYVICLLVFPHLFRRLFMLMLMIMLAIGNVQTWTVNVGVSCQRKLKSQYNWSILFTRFIYTTYKAGLQRWQTWQVLYDNVFNNNRKIGVVKTTSDKKKYKIYIISPIYIQN